MTVKRFMLRREFWLNLNNPVEGEVADIIDDLKAKRLFAKTIRDGIRLVVDLRAGRLDVLFEYFPWVRAEFLEHMDSLRPPQVTSDLDLQKRLERMEQLLLQASHVPIESSLDAPTHGPKPIKVSEVTTPIHGEDDENDQLIIRKAIADVKSGQNFLDSAFNLVG